jgi:hypothetical protein
VQIERDIVLWLNANPAPSTSDACAHCGEGDHVNDPLVPHGVASAGHTWLHRACWPAWMAARRKQAKEALGLSGAPDGRANVDRLETFVFGRMVELFRASPIPLAGAEDAAEMVVAYRDYAAAFNQPLDPDYLDRGVVPDDFDRAWREASARWLTDVRAMVNDKF